MSAANIGLLAVFCLLLTGGQLLFKAIAASHASAGTLGDKLWAVLLDPIFFGACALYAASTLLWIYILMRLPLSKAYPFVALCMLLVPLASRVFFDEALSGRYWVGAGFVALGIVLINR